MTSSDERERLAALARYQILDSAPEESFDRIARICAALLDAPISQINFIDDSRQWPKSAVGFAAEEIDRQDAFCTHTLDSDDVLVVPDATKDARFRDSPLVTGAPHTRFYAGAALRAPDGHHLGALCIVDTKPRPGLDEQQLTLLKDLAAIVEELLELRLADQRYTHELEQRTRAEEEARDRDVWVSLLQRVALGANLTSSSEEAFMFALNEICAITEWPVGHVYMYDEEAELLVPTDIWHLSDRDRFAGFVADTLNKSLDTGKGLPGTVYASRKPQLLLDLSESARFTRSESAAAAGLQAAYAFPILSGSKVVAVLEFFSVRPVDPDDGLLDVMAYIGAQLGRGLEREKAQAALRAAEEGYRSIFENSVEGIAETETDGRLVSVNPAFAKLVGYESVEDMLSEVEFIQSVWADPSERAKLIALISTTGQAEDFEFALLRRDGSTVQVSAHARAVRDADGSIVGLQGMVSDISARKKAEDAMRRGRALAEAANQAKSDFLSKMSHELRTPLNAILGFAQLLELDGLSDQHMGSVHEISRAGRHLLELINEVLDITRIETGKLALSLEPVAIDEVIEECIRLVRPLAGAKNIAIGCQTPASHAYVLADRQRVKQVLLNLLSNGIKYNYEGGELVVVCEKPSDDRVRLTVLDDGPGIREDKIDDLFTPFQRLGAENDDIEGTGLGLALTKQLVDAMGGTIVLSTAPGVGTAFGVELSAADAPDTALALEAGPIDVAEPQEEPRTILYVEDNPANMRLIERILERWPWITLLTALEGELGWDLARKHRPDLILMDLNLPDISGHELLSRLRANDLTADIPVVVLSADATHGQIERTLKIGAQVYLSKPLDVSEFLSVIQRTLLEKVA